MKSVKIRRSSVFAIIIIIGAIALNKVLSGMKEPPKTFANGNQSPLVKTRLLQQDTNSVKLNLTGRLTARDKISVLSEVTGKLNNSSKEFRDGVSFSKGDVLLSINDGDTKMKLVSARAAFQSLLSQLQADLSTDYPDNFNYWKKYIANFNPEQSLLNLPEVTDQQEKNFLIARNVYNQYYNIKSQEIQLAKFNIIAPFDGVVNNANLSPGSLIRAGQTVGQFISNNNFELEVGVTPNDISKINLGDAVKLISEDVSGNFLGRVSRISKGIDATTQTFKVYVSVSSNKLSEGLYMEAELGGKEFPNTYQIPSNLVLDNSYVYTIKDDSILTKTTIEVVHESNDYFIVEGLESNTTLLDQSLTGATDGMIVRTKSSN